MSRQTVNLGTVANDGTGDTLRGGGAKINANFAELYGAINDDPNFADSIPALVAAALATYAPTETIIVAASDETTELTTGDAKVSFHIPYDFDASEVFIGLTTVSSSGAVTVDLQRNGTTILTTLPSIAVGEDTNLTGGGTAAVIDDNELDKGDKMEVNVDAAGNDVTGLKLYLIGQRRL